MVVKAGEDDYISRSKKEFHMKTIAAKLFAFVLFGFLVSPALFATDYRYSKIDVPNSIATRVRGINARGDIVGIYADEIGSHSFLRRGGVYTEVAFPGAFFTAIKSINARGDMAGNLQDGPDGNVHGFVFHEGVFSQIDYPGAMNTQVRGINNAGDVTGTYENAAGQGAGFILKDGIYHTIRVPASDFTDVFQAQDNGNVMVGDVVLSSDGSQHGFLRLGPKNFQILDFPGTTSGTVVRWINQRGDMVGASGADGFILRDGVYTVIDFPGAVNTLGLAVNDDGVIVGLFLDRKGMLHGFKATPQ
jgi:hypothetical protein